MTFVVQVLLVAIYGLVLVLRAVKGLLWKDRLQLSRTETGSYWVARAAEPSTQSYFQETSVAEGRPALAGCGRTPGGGARFIAPMLLAAARLFAPPRETVSGRYLARADREEGIPDEVYTLW